MDGSLWRVRIDRLCSEVGLVVQPSNHEQPNRRISRACLGMILVLLSGSAESQEQSGTIDQTDSQLLLHFSKQSARQLVAHYLQKPPYPLFVIRRLIDLADPRIRPALRNAFCRETQLMRRQYLAAALVRLRDPEPQYFTYLAGWARDAVASNIPYSSEVSSGRPAIAGIEVSSELAVWAESHNLSFSDTLRAAVMELPAAVEALGEAADARSLPILIRGLSSPNSSIVRTSAFGLARLHDNIAVEPVVRACGALNGTERPLAAKALLYFNSSAAQRAADSIIADPTLLNRWRAEVKRRGWKLAMRDRAIP